MSPIDESTATPEDGTAGGGGSAKGDGGQTENPNNPKGPNRGVLRPAREGSGAGEPKPARDTPGD